MDDPIRTVSLQEALVPEGLRVYAIGDIHGCYLLLNKLLEKIEHDLTRSKPADWTIVFLGDYVDRGPDSRRVLDRLIDLKASDDRYIMLAGNHDIELLSFLTEPSMGGVFVNCGGDRTARSYGVEMNVSKLKSPDDLARLHEKVRDAIPSSHVTFLNELGFSASFGDFFFCHAGIRPGISLQKQEPEDLIWIRSPFLEGTPPVRATFMRL